MRLCTRGYRYCKRVCTGSCPWKKNPCCTRDSKLCQYCAWLFSQMLYQLSYPHSYSQSAVSNQPVEQMSWLQLCRSCSRCDWIMLFLKSDACIGEIYALYAHSSTFCFLKKSVLPWHTAANMKEITMYILEQSQDFLHAAFYVYIY